ncbi:MAG: HEAT repeat domain-containing protein [Deltaproteobacteria bacterium]|nr:HEAT repeat domain-containing protein [Deltaproteobacteria bacterium]
MAIRCLVLLSFLMVLPGLPRVLGDKLPTGELQTIRERTFDLIHLRADLELEPAEGSVLGVAKLTLAPLFSTDSFCLDAFHLEVEKVLVTGHGAVEFDNQDRQICLELPVQANRGEQLEISVSYSAAPKAGMYFQPDRAQEGLYYVTTFGEGGLHANWLPLYNANNDKFTSEMVISVPKAYSLVSNGRLVEERDEGGRRIFHWHQERPHPHYLIALYGGDFERGELEPAFGEIPLAYWVPRGRLEEGAYTFRNTKRMMEVFSERFDFRYPWIKYDQLAIPDYAIGAMEHTGVTGHDASVLRLPGVAPTDFSNPNFSDYHTGWTAEATIAHELAHHWFGDDLTCAHLGQIWLNESFASYLMMLWGESDLGTDQLALDVDHARHTYFSYVAAEHIIRPLEFDYFDSPNDIYNQPHTYFKGAAVLHMLRGILGDEDFFRSLSHYLHSHSLEAVQTHHLKDAIQRTTGKNLDWFFGDWITGGGHPQFEVESRFLAGPQLLELSVKQVQSIVEGQDLFRLPVTITLATESRRWQEKVWVSEEEHHFFLPMKEEPKMVSFDGEGFLVAEVSFEKSLEDLLYQGREDAVAGRLWALRQLAEHFPTRQETGRLFTETLNQEETFWGLRAEAAQLLGQVRTPEAEAAAIAALEFTDERLRTAAVLGLESFGTQRAQRALHKAMVEDPHGDVSATALMALSRSGTEVAPETLKRLLARKSWNDELHTAVAMAAQEGFRPELLELVRPLAASPHNQETRGAALAAWGHLAPEDPQLHRTLISLAKDPAYVLQQQALASLGNLYVEDARPVLQEFVDLDVDANLTQLARDSLHRLDRLKKAVP